MKTPSAAFNKAGGVPIPVAGPGKITKAGCYRLTSHVSHLTKGIEITADDVVLDLGGYAVTCGQDDEQRKSAITTGILVCGKRVTIHNGAVSGFWRGIHAVAADHLVVHSVDLSRNTYMGLSVIGTGVRVYGNTIADIGGYRLESYAIGINALTIDGLFYGNVVRNLYRQPGALAELRGEGVAILLGSDARDNVIRNNWIENDEVRPDTIGIWSGREGKSRITQNAVTNFGLGVCGGGYASGPLTVDDNRFLLRSSLNGSIAISADFGTAADNVIVDYELPISGTIDTRNNRVAR